MAASAAARLITAVKGTPSEDGVKEILKTVSPDAKGKGAEGKLAEVRALLAQLQDVFKTSE